MHIKCNIIYLSDEVGIHSDFVKTLRQIIISQQGRIKHLFDMTEHEICKKYGYIQKGTSIILMVT